MGTPRSWGRSHTDTTYPSGCGAFRRYGTFYAILVLLSKILIEANRAQGMARSLDPRRILILLLRSQRRKRAAVRAMAPHSNIEFIIDIEERVKNFISILSLHANLLSSTILQRKELTDAPIGYVFICSLWTPKHSRDCVETRLWVHLRISISHQLLWAVQSDFGRMSRGMTQP